MSNDKAIKQYVLENLEKDFKISPEYINKENTVLANGKQIDFIGISYEGDTYLINARARVLREKDMWQLFENINVYRATTNTIFVKGIIYCTDISEETNEAINLLNEFITVHKVEDLKTTKSKFTTTLSDNTIKLLRATADKYEVGDINCAIEILAKKEWGLN